MTAACCEVSGDTTSDWQFPGACPLSLTEFAYVDYLPEFGLETVKMWRRSFQQAVGIEVHNRFDELEAHLGYFKTFDAKATRIVLDTETSVVVGLMTLADRQLHHLFVHVDYQRRGIGSKLIREARERAPEGFDLFTFQRNTGAQAFYISQGFEEVERGFAEFEANPWARTKEDLADIKYRWSP